MYNRIMAKQHYINNQDFLNAIKDYKAVAQDAENAGDPKPPVPEYIGECILQIANHLSHKPNFINYTYRDEMISDGIENCLMYFDNFDPNKSSNPFAYFTQIIYYAFIRRIQKEKKQTLIKSKMIVELMPFEMFDTQDQDVSDDFSPFMEMIQQHSIYNDIVAKEEKRKAKIKQKKVATLVDLLEGEEELL